MQVTLEAIQYLPVSCEPRDTTNMPRSPETPRTRLPGAAHLSLATLPAFAPTRWPSIPVESAPAVGLSAMANLSG